MDAFLPETQECLKLMAEIEDKQTALSQLQTNREVRVPAEVRQLLAREQVDLVIGAGRDLVQAVDRVSQKDAELKILSCEANELADKATKGQVVLCKVPADQHHHLLNVLTAKVISPDTGLKEAVVVCSRLSDFAEKQSIQSMKAAAELKSALQSLD